jgi:hypothetical protein
VSVSELTTTLDLNQWCDVLKKLGVALLPVVLCAVICAKVSVRLSAHLEAAA